MESLFHQFMSTLPAWTSVCWCWTGIVLTGSNLKFSRYFDHLLEYLDTGESLVSCKLFKLCFHFGWFFFSLISIFFSFLSTSLWKGQLFSEYGWWFEFPNTLIALFQSLVLKKVSAGHNNLEFYYSDFLNCSLWLIYPEYIGTLIIAMIFVFALHISRMHSILSCACIGLFFLMWFVRGKEIFALQHSCWVKLTTTKKPQ